MQTKEYVNRLFLWLFFASITTFDIGASDLAGVYHSTVNCRNNYKVTLSIFNTEHNNFIAFMRVEYGQNERNSWLMEGEYLGRIEKDKLHLYLQNSSQVKNEKQSRKNYFHGIRYKPKSEPFIRDHLEITKESGFANIRILIPNKSWCAMINLPPAEEEIRKLSIKRYENISKYSRWTKGLKKAKLEADKVTALLKWSEIYRKKYPNKRLKIRGNRDKLWDSADSPFQLFLPKNVIHLGYDLSNEKEVKKLLKKINVLNRDCHRLAQKKKNTFEYRLTFEVELLKYALEDCVYRMDMVCKGKLDDWLNKAENDKSRFYNIQRQIDNREITHVHSLKKLSKEINEDFLLPSYEEKLSLIRTIENQINEFGAAQLAKYIDKFESTTSSLQNASDLLSKKQDPYIDQVELNQLRHLISKIDDKVGTTMDKFFKQHSTELESSVSFKDFNSRAESILNSYPSNLKNHITFHKIESFVTDERCEKLASNLKKIMEHIEQAQNRDELYSVKRDFLNYDYSNSCSPYVKITNEYEAKGLSLDERLASARNQNIINGDRSLSLNTSGLQYAKVIQDFFQGKFENISFEREDATFIFILDFFLQQYFHSCGSNLPQNKVEMTRKECVREQVTTNGWGVEVSRTCVEWVTVGTGVYADPEMNRAMNQVNQLYARDGLKNMVKVLKNPMEETSNLGVQAIALKSDVARLFHLNECKGKGIVRLQENLKLFANNKRSIRLDKITTGYIELSIHNQNFAKLIDDLVRQQARDWVFNQYSYNSISKVEVINKDAQDRPIEIRANYRYKSGFGGYSNGSLRLTFTDGLPECIYFSDYPTTCRTANRKVKLDYERGKYSK